MYKNEQIQFYKVRLVELDEPTTS